MATTDDGRTFWETRNRGFLALGAGLAIAFCLLLTAATQFQDSAPAEPRPVRVHLKSGVSIDAESLRETPRTLILVLSSGELVVRRELVDRIEVLKPRPRIDRPARTTPPAVVPPRHSESPGSGAMTPAALRGRIDAILSEFQTATDLQRHELLQELAKLAPPAIADLVRRLEVSPPPTRSLIAAALIAARDSVPVADLESARRSRKPEVRAETARILGAIGTPAAVPPIAAFRDDPSPIVRDAAVHALGVVGTREAFRALIPFCVDADRNVRLHALQSLPPFAERSECEELMEAALLKAFDQTQGEARADVVAVMGVSGRKGLARALYDALRDESPQVRAAVVSALVNLGLFGWQEWIVDRYLREEEPCVRIALAGAAESLQLPGAISPLISWLSSPDSGVVQAALKTLKALTNRDYGTDAALWTAWWESARRK